MTSPRGTYGGSYYSSPAFVDTPIYDSLVAERGTPQIAPIRVPSAYEPSHLPALPALPSSVPAPTPAYGTQTGYAGTPQPAYQHAAPLQNAPVPSLPQQAGTGRGGYNAGYANNSGYPVQGSYPGAAPGYDTGARPVPPRPAPPRQAPPSYGQDAYRRPYPNQGY